MKNYVNFVNDHSGSMHYLAGAAIRDYNANIAAVRDAATSEMLDTVVSVVGLGLKTLTGIKRQVCVSNPHVLKPISQWPAEDNTPLWDAIGNMLEMLQALPDAQDPEVSFLVMVTTDGGENGSRRYSQAQIASMVNHLQGTGRWTFVARVPNTKAITTMQGAGFLQGNIQIWDTTVAGMAKSTERTKAAMDTFYKSRTAGAKSSGSFYADAATVNVAALEDVTSKVSLYVVPGHEEGCWIRDFILKHRSEYLKGAAFYQLTKTEPKVSHTKKVLVRDRATGKIFAGDSARKMIGLPTDRNARLHPGDHKAFDLFIQSESVNRKLVGGTGVVYWKEIGVQYAPGELDYLLPKATAVVAPGPVVLPAVPVSNSPTKSPIPVTPRFRYFDTRDEARQYCAIVGKIQAEIAKNPGGAKGRKWTVPNTK